MNRYTVNRIQKFSPFLFFLYGNQIKKLLRNSVLKAKASFVLTNGVNDATGVKR